MFSITHEWIFVHHEEKLWHLGSTPHKLAFDHLPTHTSTLQLPYEIVFLSRDHATIRSQSKLDLKLVVPVQFLKFFWKYFGQGTLNYSPSDFLEPHQLCLREMYTIQKIDISSAVHFFKICQLSLVKAAHCRCKIFKISSTKAEDNVPQCKTSKISSTEVERAMYPRPKFHFESASQSWGAYIT